MANTDRARKLLVRTALVTSTTIATIVGAQNLAMLDANQFLPTDTPATENVSALLPNATPTPMKIVQAAPEITIFRAAPGIVILRQSGEITRTFPSAGSSTTAIQPPTAARITAPDPVIVQQFVPQRSHSSR